MNVSQFIHQDFSGILFPNRCLECNVLIPKDEVVCENCFDKVHFTHWDFDSQNSLKEKCKTLFPVHNAFALMEFEEESLSRKLVHRLKYNNHERTGKKLAEWTTQFVDFKENTPDLFVTVPLHPKKEKKRGYNQLHLFAKTLSDHYKIPLDNELLKRNFHSNKAQAKQNKQQRLKAGNLFSLTKPISKSHVLIIDDVFTTGNTVANIAWEILKSGGNKVSVLVMAMDY